MANILVVEDDGDINSLLETILRGEGHQVTTAFSGSEGKLRLEMATFDLMVCDLMLPGLSGESLIEWAFKNKPFPIIALTAKGHIDDKVRVLGLGACDYMTKPFEKRELLARIQAHMRKDDRSNNEGPSRRLTFKDMVMDTDGIDVRINHKVLDLTAHEFALLRVMLTHPKKVFTKESLYESVWDKGYYGEDNTISVHISNIRKKISKVTTDPYITTVWGCGYKLKL